MVATCLMLSCILFCGGGLIWSKDSGLNVLIKLVLFGMGIFCLVCFLQR